MHVVVGNELHSRYDKVELVFPDGDERQINKASGAGVRTVADQVEKKHSK